MPAFPDPHVVAIVELDEGPRLVSNLAGDGEPSVGMRVEVSFETPDGVQVLPLFRRCDP
jgi:uncharacterized OB-fold protein